MGAKHSRIHVKALLQNLSLKCKKSDLCDPKIKGSKIKDYSYTKMIYQKWISIKWKQIGSLTYKYKNKTNFHLQHL